MSTQMNSHSVLSMPRHADYIETVTVNLHGVNLAIILGLFGVEYHGSAGKSVAQFYIKNWGFQITNSLRMNVIPGEKLN